MLLQIEAYLDDRLRQALRELNYPQVEYQFDQPRAEAHGDISVNVAMPLAKQVKKPPREIAAAIVERLDVDPQQIEKVEIAGPGFINFFLAPSLLQKAVPHILQEKDDYGRFPIGKGKKAQVEFVSANPTGPLTVGHGRQAVLGDTVANLLEWASYDVQREYYFNNAGRQMRILADSVRLRYLELLGETVEFPDDYYQGEYIRDIARHILETHGDSLKNSDDLTIFKETAERLIFEDI
ncbi:MAG TPA: arginine--tRNA ligase, partial [Calditrichae bacterium]|nr:arginine--tRNA ligase [Calditrichia bacterium]